MNKPVPWNVKGVGFDAREAARIAARRAGMPVGEWLNSVISDRAAALGVRTDEIDPDDRLETIAARLSEVDRETFGRVLPETKAQIGSRESASAVAPPRRSAADRQSGRFGETETVERLGGGRAASAVGLSPVRAGAAGRLSEPATNVMEADNAPLAVSATASARMASGAAAAMRAPVSYASKRPEVTKTVQAESETIERATTEAHRRAVTSASGADRPKRAVPTTGNRILADSEGLDTRLASILDKLNRSFEEAERFGREAAADTFDRSRASSRSVRETGGRNFRNAVDAISSRQVMLDAPNDDLAVVDRRRGRDEVRFTPSRNERVLSAVAPKTEIAASGAAFADLHAAFRTLSDKLDARLVGLPTSQSERGHPNDGPDYRSLKSDISGLAERIEMMHADPRAREAASRTTADLDAVRQEIAHLSVTLADLAPRQSLESLEVALRELTGRVDLSKLDGVQASVLAPVERLSREMREAIRSADPSKTVDELRREMKSLATKVEAIPLQSVNSDILDRIQIESHEMREMLGHAAERLAVTERLEQEIAKLGQRVDELADRTTPAMSRDLAHAVGDVRALLKGLDAEGILGEIDRKIDTLAARIDGLSNTQPRSDFDDLSRQIEHAHESLAARLASRETEPVDLGPLEERIGILSAKLDSFGRESHDVNALYGLVGGLVDRIDEARGPQADNEILNALQSQIGQLVERLDRSEASHAMLSGLDRSIGDLFLQIEQSRNIAIDAAENAARTAAQDTLRAAMDNPTLNGGELAVQTGLDVDHVSQELSDLRRAHEASELRVNATLTALNTTLERLVDRLVNDHTRKEAKVDRPGAAASADTMDGLDARSLRRRGQRNRSEQARGLREEPSDQAPFDPDTFLLEPGSDTTAIRGDRLRRSAESSSSAVPQVNLGLGSVGEPASDVGPLIAAARRAAQAAQASALEATLRVRDPSNADGGEAAESKTRSFFSRRRRPLLLSLAGLVLLLGTLQIVKLSFDQNSATAPVVKDPEASGSGAKSEPAPAAPSLQKGPEDTKPASDGGASLLAPPTSGSGAPTNFTTPGKSNDASQLSPAASGPDTAALAGVSQGLRDLAVGGNAAAQFEVAVRLSEGRNVTRDAAQAVSWFQRAAKQGLAPAQYRLGSLYEKGVGTAADPALAVAWYEKAASQGNVRAMHNLAVMSAEGTGAKPDYAKAAAWFTKAANSGVRDSQFNLAVLYARGLGVSQSLGQSYTWFSIAAGQGDKDALTKRDAVAAKLDAKSLDDAKSAVESYRPIVPTPAANEVAPPPGGWDAVAPAKTAFGPNGKSPARLSSM